MAASTRFFSLAAIVTVASGALALSAAPASQELAHRASGRIELAHRGSERLDNTLAYRGSGRLDSNGGSGLLAYRGNGRLSQDLATNYRGSERGIEIA